MLITSSIYLSELDRVRLGAYYTPYELVCIVQSLIKPYITDKAIIFDSSGGYGTFISKEYNYRIAEYDPVAYGYLKDEFDQEKVYYTNSLLDVSREKYNISDDDYLIIVGNPPYNDITSSYRKGNKGTVICDNDIYDRDLGISFLKSYNKLKADIVCVLHPLSYLIKETNFNRLKDFKKNYKLIHGITFSSKLFSNTGKQKFPILIALYEKAQEGMTYEYIRNFEFDVLDDDDFKFVLSHYMTTDGIINKYPPRKNEEQTSPINLYYYSFRDINSLRNNTSFLNYKCSNAIVVTVENFYHYAYLYCFKTLFNYKNKMWLIGNLSPLIDLANFEFYKSYYIVYAIETNKILRDISPDIKEKILSYYNIELNDFNILDVEKTLLNSFEIFISNIPMKS